MEAQNPLPSDINQTPEPVAQSTTQAPAQSGSLRVKPMVLLVEDENLITIMYSKKLELDGYECVVAHNGQEGLKYAKEKLPDLILCDIMMPIKDGLSTLKDLKADDSTKGIPVIMLSNLSDEKYVTQALDMGAVSFLIKSKILPADVITKVKEVLSANGKTSLLSKAA